MIKAPNDHAEELGFVYLCNPNNPTGIIVTKQEMQQLLDGIPKDMPVLIDEAYHHFVNDPNYATSVPVHPRRAPGDRRADVLEDRGARRHATRIRDRDAELVQQMRPYSIGSINALVKYGGAARSRTRRHRPR